ncbi:MAG: hypothetical protein HY334_00205 [Armatimonadetes bacterium]|nr:hypothetical protein [Armatimonadota bacterium]
MSKGREELRRGVREILEGASQEMEALAEATVPHRHQTVEARPLLRLVREPVPASGATAPAPPAGPGAPRTMPPAPGGEPALPEAPVLLPKKGVCQAYFINRRCWEVPEAFCNTALQVCMTRECPVYHLYKDELERRFAAKYQHFW